MCGIASIHSSGSSLNNSEEVLDAMMIRIAHRGPDGDGKIHLKNQALLGHLRLAIIDL